MALRDIPAVFMRGGTSKALVFRAEDLPDDRKDWDEIFLAAMGTPDPYGRQLDGMGGGLSSLSKVCVVGQTSRADADVDFTFAQVSVDTARVDYAGNCGNMVSAIGPIALDFGIIRCPGSAKASVRIHNTNTGKIIVSHFPVLDGALDPFGALAIDGVPGTAAPIRLDFLNPGGAKTGALLPTGNVVDRLHLADGTHVLASLVDAANPCVFVAASDLNLTGTEHPADLTKNQTFLTQMETIRCAGAVAMGMAADLATAAANPSVPKVAIVAPPTRSKTISGREIDPAEMSLLVRMFSMEQPHQAVPITGAICLALAARIPGTIPNDMCPTSNAPLQIAHPSGTILVDANVTEESGKFSAQSGSVYRTARKLFTGVVHYRAR